MTTVEAIKQLFVGAGASWVLWLLAALSVASVAVFVERWYYLRRRGGDVRALAETLDKHLGAGEPQKALETLSHSPSVAAQIAAAGLKLGDRGPAAAEKAMQSALVRERGLLESRLSFLGTLGNNAPFVGLFGTVIGVIQAFEELGHSAPGHGGSTMGSAASQVASQAVMSAIAEALVATAVGIAVALPAVAAYNFLQRKVAALLDGSEVLSNLLMAYLVSAPKGPESR